MKQVHDTSKLDMILCYIEKVADTQEFPIDEQEGYVKACRLITKWQCGVINNKQKDIIIEELQHICFRLNINFIQFVEDIAKEAWSK